MNSIWNKNYSAFQKRFPQLAQLVGSVPYESEKLWQLVKAKNGQISANEGTLHLHSAYNPEKEANTAVASEEIYQKSTTVFYGFGLGYHVIEWAKKAGELLSQGKIKKLPKLFLIESDVRYFLSALTLLDWTPVFELENLILAIGCPIDQILPLLEDTSKVNLGNSGVSDAYFFDIPVFQNHAKQYFDAVKTLVKRNQRKNEINAATLKKFGKLWCRNSIKNISKITECSSITSLENICKNENINCPFLIIGAGPSLDNILPYIKELKERMIIICVETALRAMLRRGVEPDFIILTDPQFWAYRHIAGLSSPSSILITEVSAYPAVFRFPCKKVLLCGSQFLVGQWFESQLGIECGDLGTGGSVASSAWNFAYFCGAKEIYLAGLDFAFPGKQTHIRGSSAEQTYHTISNRLGSTDNFTSSAIFGANAASGVDYSGNEVITDSRMKMFSWWFESRLAGCPDVKTFTLCPEGLKTPGIATASLQTALQLPALATAAAGNGRGAMMTACEKMRISLPKEKHNKLQKLLSTFPSKDFLGKYPELKIFF